MVRLICLSAMLPLAGALTAHRADVVAEANPIRKVVTLLQKMQKKVEAESSEAEALYKKFMCYCKSSGGDLAGSISAAEAKIPELAAAITASTSRKQQLEEDLKSHQHDRASAKAAVQEATAIRKKEKATYDKDLADNRADLAATKKASAAISEGMGSFLQTAGADRLRKLVNAKQDMSEADRTDMLAFLAGKQEGEYAPASGQIVGILKTMADEMQSAQDEMIATEKGAVSDFKALTAARKKEIATLSGAIEVKLARVGQLGVEIATLKNDAGDTAEALEADKKFAANLETNCAEKDATHEEEAKLRVQEMAALADTIKVLNDDDALELFKKTLPSASSSFIQVQQSDRARLAKATKFLAKGPRNPRLDFILLALHGKKVGFGKVLQLIDELVASLKKEQVDDDSKKEFCSVQIDQTEDKIKGLKNSIAGNDAAVADGKENAAMLVEEIAALKAGIVALDKALAEATENRQAEHAEYKDLFASNTASKEVILFAKNRMNKFYNPKLYKAPPKRELSKGDRIYVNEGGDIPTAAPGGIANTGIQAFVQIASDVAPAPPPATAAAYTKSSQEGNGVIAMMNLLVQDLDKQLAEAATEEKNAQAAYEQTVADSAEKRRDDSKSLTDKETARADLADLLQKLADEARGLGREEMGAAAYLSNLHAECDWLVKYYDVRKQARSDEIDSLGNAKAVLSGADFSMLQQAARGFKSQRHA